MFNQNSPIIQNMINTGQFGYQQPMQNYNPYSNMIPISQVGYNQNNGLTYAPVNGGYDYGYQQPMNYNPYMQQQMYYGNQPQYNYYDPYGGNGSNMYGNPYAQNATQQFICNYGGGYNNYYASPLQQQAMVKQQQSLMKLKYKIAGKFFGKEYSEQELESLVNPEVRMQQMSREEIEQKQFYSEMLFYKGLIDNPPIQTNAMVTAQYLADTSNNYHKEFDDRGLRDFLADDLWKLKREFWLKENANVRGRDLSNTYSSKDYNELLGLHMSSNPYINELLDTSRYDNNLDDMEIGLPALMKARQERQINIKVPDFISSPEIQKRRNEFTNQILQQINGKTGGMG